jgi:hypothetical protein
MPIHIFVDEFSVNFLISHGFVRAVFFLLLLGTQRNVIV